MDRARELVWPVLLLVLLAVLAWLQYRWMGQVSRAERERMQASLQSSMRRFIGDIEDEAVLLFRSFLVEPSEDLGGVLGERLDSYASEARYPDLVAAIYVVDADRDLSTLTDEHRLVPADWPAGLREHLRARRARPDRRRRVGAPFPFPVLSGDPPAVIVPMIERGARWPQLARSGFTLVLLDIETVRAIMFPELAARHFGEDYDVVIADGDGDVVFATGDEDAVKGNPDARSELFSPFRFVARSGRRGERPPPPPDAPELRIDGRRDPVDDGGHRWQVYVRHRSGSLEAAVATARARNLAIGFGILGLLAASIVLVAVSTRRATELNDRKMEFVAGVSHELRTPVAVLRSAGQNLADGSVSDPDQVKRYGALIESEGRRLDDLVEQVLELAGIQSHKRRYRREPVPAKALVGDVLADCESSRRERGVEITTRFGTEDATLMGERDALRRALGNLVMNAIKHGGDDNAIEIAVGPRGSSIAIVVSDRGPGIPEADRAHLFEPFYRGSRAQERQVPGSGLGLSLVDHVAREHGGSVEVESVPGEGSRFTLYIPGVAGN